MHIEIFEFKEKLNVLKIVIIVDYCGILAGFGYGNLVMKNGLFLSPLV